MPQAPATRVFAYFSMEVALDPKLPTYSGGLGVLAGDTLRAAADMAMPVVAMTLLYRKGFFEQKIDKDGKQIEMPVHWDPRDMLTLLPARTTVTIEGRTVAVAVWRYEIKGEKGHKVPVYFLDADLPENAAADRVLTDNLYGGDERYRLGQEALLGLGGVSMLEALGLPPCPKLDDPKADGVAVYHMNEGHAALLTIALLAKGDEAFVRERCVFTTHTPVPAGHDTFPMALAEDILGKATVKTLTALEVCPGERLNMSHLAIRLSRFVNGVAKRHAEVSRRMFPGTRVEAITNGVHSLSWTADAVRTLFDKHLDGWRQDNNYLRFAAEIPLQDMRSAHAEAKAALLKAVKDRSGVSLDPGAFTIGFARRAAEYKRADLLFHAPERLKAMAKKHPLQIVFAGKAHPKDMGGKHLIEKVVAGAKELAGAGVKVVYLENYDMTLGRLITSGVDLWLNNPVKPLEASGTSGMKAAINGVPSLSTLDGWWVEGYVAGAVGWEIEDPADAEGDSKDDGRHRDIAAGSIYDLLERVILPMYYQQPDAYAEIMRNCVTINGPYFNTHRMVLQYLVQAYTRNV